MNESPSVPERKQGGSGNRNRPDHFPLKPEYKQEYNDGKKSIASRPNNSMEQSAKNRELAQLFECPVCFDYVLPPIMQCNSGHLVCQNCQPKLTVILTLYATFITIYFQHCPTCRGQAPSIRNLGMEKVAETVQFPCKWKDNGCLSTHYHNEKSQHEGLFPTQTSFKEFF